ncbi:3933_t:CDS:1, partial [Cetraspora pellucida]
NEITNKILRVANEYDDAKTIFKKVKEFTKNEEILKKIDEKISKRKHRTIKITKSELKKILDKNEKVLVLLIMNSNYITSIATTFEQYKIVVVITEEELIKLQNLLLNE